MSLPRRLDALQRRRPWLGFPIAVVFKFADDHGVYLSALITYYGFLALFPLLLLLTSVLGFLLEGESELRDRILETAVSQFPVLGSQLDDPTGFSGSTPAVVIGALLALWGGIRASQATLHMMNTCWAVPRHQRPDPLRSPLHSLQLIGVAGVMLLGTTAVSVVAGAASSLGVELRSLVQVLVVGLSFLVALVFFAMGMRFGTVYAVTWAQVLPGAVLSSVAWLLLQQFGIAYVGRVVQNSGDAYGVFAVVLGLVGFLFITAQVVVLSVEVNVVRAKRLWPRALLAPFTDDVELTEADQRIVEDVAAATTVKDYQEVEVRFDQPAADADGPDEPEERPA